MSIVDSYFLKYEVEAQYPYSTTICDTEEQARERIQWEKDVHDVRCRVRVVGEWTSYFGDPKRKVQ